MKPAEEILRKKLKRVVDEARRFSDLTDDEVCAAIAGTLVAVKVDGYRAPNSGERDDANS